MQPTAEEEEVVRGRKGRLSEKRRSPQSAATRGRFTQDLRAMARQVVLSVWCFVQPAFDPKSEVRKRWHAGQHRLLDIVIFAAAAGSVIAALCVIILGIRVVVIGLQIVRCCWNVLRFLVDF